MADEMIEDVAKILTEAGIDCRTPHEWMFGKKQKDGKKIHDAELRKFLQERKAEGEDITLITADYDSWMQIKSDGLPVMFVPEIIRNHIRESMKFDRLRKMDFQANLPR